MPDRAHRRSDRVAARQRAGGSDGDTSFASVLKEAIGSVSRGRPQIRRTDRARMAAGKANMVDVVTAVCGNRSRDRAVVAVRDRVIQAYEEIMKMPI